MEGLVRVANRHQRFTVGLAVLEVVGLLFHQPLQDGCLFFSLRTVVVQAGQLKSQLAVRRVGGGDFFQERPVLGGLTGVLILLDDHLEQIEVAAFEGVFLKDFVENRLKAAVANVSVRDFLIELRLLKLLHGGRVVFAHEVLGGLPAVELRQLLQRLLQGPARVALLHLLLGPLPQRFLTFFAVAFHEVKAGERLQVPEVLRLVALFRQSQDRIHPAGQVRQVDQFLEHVGIATALHRRLETLHGIVKPLLQKRDLRL